MEHRVQLNRILLLLMMTVCVTQATSIVLSKYKKIQSSQNITGTVEAQHTIKSSQECAVRCSGEPQCDAYQYKTPRPENCLLINGNTTEGQGQIFTSIKENAIYEKDAKCKNGGTPMGGGDEYNCTCLPGYTGVDCGINVNECDPSACQNGGTCIDGINQYSCICVAGFIGTDCENIDECEPEPCQNGGTCSDGNGTYSCECTSGFNGTDCQTNIDECTVSNPCHEKATCNDTFGSFNSLCDPGFTGDGLNCTDIDECEMEIHDCHVNGTCENKEGTFKCHCGPWYQPVDGYNGVETRNCTLGCSYRYENWHERRCYKQKGTLLNWRGRLGTWYIGRDLCWSRWDVRSYLVEFNTVEEMENVTKYYSVQSRSYTKSTWLGGIVTPEGRNSTSARSYTWSYTNETVSDAIFPWANRTIFPDTVGETCLYWDAFEIKEAPCDSDGVDGGNTYIICETVHDMPLTFNDIPPYI